MFKWIKDLFSIKPSEKNRQYRIVYFQNKNRYAVQCNKQDEIWYNMYLWLDHTYWGIKVTFDVLKSDFSSKEETMDFLQNYLNQKCPIVVQSI